MYISRIVIRGFRSFAKLDLKLSAGVTCVIGANNTGKTNLLHALRLVLDAGLSSQFRQLIEHDIHSDLDISTPAQVVVSVEFTGYQDNVNECALVGCCEVEEGTARLHYRFRPVAAVRDDIEAGTREPTGLTLDDYGWELTGSGEHDPAAVEWNEDLGASLRFSDLQAYNVEYLSALRDVQHTFRQSYASPLSRLLATSEMPQGEKDELVRILREANAQVAARPPLATAGADLTKAFADAAGEAFPLRVRLGMVDPSFASISRSISVLLSNNAIEDFDPSRNGVGLNNILHFSVLLEYFARRVAQARSAGQLLLIEEPEAHLHPQLQRVLYDALQARGIQAIITTHSTFISSHAPLQSYVVLTETGTSAVASSAPIADARLTPSRIADLERYLDATRSTLLFARRVILVEGPAEMFLIPALVKKVLGIDLDRQGISVVPIYGVHFESYAALFGPDGIRKRCAIIADGDLTPSDASTHPEDEAMPVPNLDGVQNEFVRVFQCETTFERALTIEGLLLVLAGAADECGATTIARSLRECNAFCLAPESNREQKISRLESCKSSVLNTAKRFGKARFAQVASKHVEHATAVPAYISDALRWALEP